MSEAGGGVEAENGQVGLVNSNKAEGSSMETRGGFHLLELHTASFGGLYLVLYLYFCTFYLYLYSNTMCLQVAWE